MSESKVRDIIGNVLDKATVILKTSKDGKLWKEIEKQEIDMIGNYSIRLPVRYRRIGIYLRIEVKR